MADKSTRLIRDALSRAAAEPDGFALFGSKSEPGLFPSSSFAKAAADHCKDEGFLHVLRTETKGKLAREICVLTDKGRHFLIRQSNPNEVLEDFVRALENRQRDVAALAESVSAMQRSLDGIRAAVEHVLPRLNLAPSVNGKSHQAATVNGLLIGDLKAKLAEWHVAAGASEDCPLPELYRRLDTSGGPTIGQFHDCLRQLNEDRMIYLHPWTGPLYEVPEPAYALLVGHEIAYYASIR